MSEKLDLFELSVKRGLENYEVPMEEGAWNQFQTNLNPGTGASAAGTGGTSFLSKFGLAAAAIAAAGFFINYNSAPEQEQAHHPVSIDENDSSHTTSSGQDRDAVYVVDANDFEGNNNDDRLAADLAAANAEVSKDLEEKRILNINKRLQEAADRKENADRDLEKKTTTRYVGKNFDLDAPSRFTPNNDGKDDYFMPSELKSNEHFTMTISDDKGIKVFRSADIQRPWMGTDSTGNMSPDGYYSWEVVLHKDNNNTEIFRGVVKLDRSVR